MASPLFLMILANRTGLVLRQVRDKCQAPHGAINILTSTTSSQSLFEMGSGLHKGHLVWCAILLFGHLPLGLNDPVQVSRHGLDQGLAEGWRCSALTEDLDLILQLIKV